MNTLKLTEKEAIEYTIAKGFKGGEFETQAWKQRNCLRKDGESLSVLDSVACMLFH